MKVAGHTSPRAGASVISNACRARVSALWFVLLTGLFLAACAGRNGAREDGTVRGLADLFLDGRTTRTDVRDKLGQPTAAFEQGRLLVYLVARNKKEGFLPFPREVVRDAEWESEWIDEEYSVVLVFDGDVLQRHSLVRFRE